MFSLELVERRPIARKGINVLRLENEMCEMHTCLRYPMRLCRWAGLFPVEGLEHRFTTKLRYNLKSVYFLYYTMTILGQAVITGFCLYQICTSKLCLVYIANFMFCAGGLNSAILLSQMARHWPVMMKKAAKLEHRLAEIRIKKNAARRSNIIAYLIMLLALVEHLFSVSFNLNLVLTCTSKSIYDDGNIHHYFSSTMSYIFDYIPYNIWIALFFEMARIQATFLWSFTDVLIICFSMYLTSHFQDFNTIAHRDKNTIVWKYLRIKYSQLVALVKQVDSKIKFFVLLSFFINLFFICHQLFNTLKTLHGIVHTIYYAYSFLFLVMRVLLMSYMAADVYRVAQQPVASLYDISTLDYNIEVQRFHRQLRYTTTALSGLIFYVTPEMMLKVVGTIITYELVLLKYGNSNTTKMIEETK